MSLHWITIKGDGGLEFKTLTVRQMLDENAGTAEIFEKVRLGDDATPKHIVDHLRKERGSVSEELEMLLLNNVSEVEVEKSVRKKKFKDDERGKVSFEATGTRVSELSVSLMQVSR